MIKFLIEKEFKQLLRNSFLPKMILIFPCMIMILMPWAANLEIKNINLNIVDNDHSVLSRRLVDKIGASTYFRTTALPDTYNEGLRSIEIGSADIILEIPRDFEKNWVTGKSPRLLVAVNAVNGTKGGLGGSYLSSIINDYTRELQSELPARAMSVGMGLPRIGISAQNLYNPNLNYKLFMVPALMVMLLTMICGFLPALNVVGEKEVGTIEQINVTPVSKLTFILAKLIPYWLIGFIVLTICFFLAWLLYGILPVGHFVTIYLCSGLPVRGLRIRSGDFQSFRYVAAGHVRHVVLYADTDADERLVHSRTQYAGVGTTDCCAQSAEIFCRGDAYHLPAGWWHCGVTFTVGSIDGLCGVLQFVGGEELQKE